MKIYLVDNCVEIKKVLNELSKKCEMEIKDTCKFRSNKSDVVIAWYNKDVTELKSNKNLIIITLDKTYKTIWDLSNNYNTIDIIDGDMDTCYITNRINKKLEML